MKSFFCSGIFICLFFLLEAQADFPAKWIGIWSGTLQMLPNSELQPEIEVSLQIEKSNEAGTYIWKTTYKTPTGLVVKDYLLRETDAEKGLFEMNEQNGILIPSSFLGNELWSLFEVGGVLLTAIYQFSPESISLTISSARRADEMRSGGVILNNDSIPVVISYPVYAIQKVILKKSKS